MLLQQYAIYIAKLLIFGLKCYLNYRRYLKIKFAEAAELWDQKIIVSLSKNKRKKVEVKFRRKRLRKLGRHLNYWINMKIGHWLTNRAVSSATKTFFCSKTVENTVSVLSVNTN